MSERGNSERGRGRNSSGWLDPLGSTQPASANNHAGRRMPSLSNVLPDELNGYRVLTVLGQGGMGKVYHAVDIELDRDVALKFIRSGRAHADRLLEEARAAAKLHHANIAAVYAIDQFQNERFIVSEFVDGENLRLVMATRHRMPWRDALDLGLKLASGVAALHRRHILHRDIKPENIVISDEGEPKLVDFGLATILVEADDQEARLETVGNARPLLGTPHYMAPEIWRREPATPRSDVYALGVTLYFLAAGHEPHCVATTQHQIERATCDHDAPSLAAVVGDVDPRFAAIVDRCLAREPAQRYESGDALRDALQSLHWSQRALPLPKGNPYPGLEPFGVEHRGSFFGRDRDIEAVIERVRTDHFVVVAGDSGVGKSSLLRAGVLPRLQGQDLGDGRRYSIVPMVPEGDAMNALIDGLGPRLEPGLETSADDESDNEFGFEDEDLARDEMLLQRRLRAYHRHHREHGTLIFVDQLEELGTLESEAEAIRFAELLVHLADHAPGVRVITTVRTDKVSTLTSVPALGPRLERMLHIVMPLDEDAVREVIVGPARSKGVAFESEALVDTLVSEARGGLPLLQFALHELWERLAPGETVIRAATLNEIGGVAGALASHADKVLTALGEATREAAEYLLLELVSSAGMSRPRTEQQLVGDDDYRRHALAVLYRARLLTVSGSGRESRYRIAHEALLTGWPRLRQLLDREGGLRAVRERLAGDAEEWQDKDRSDELLWGTQRLRDASPLDAQDLPEPDRTFLRLSRRRRTRRRWMWRLTVVSPLLLLAAAYALFAFLGWNERRGRLAAVLAEVDELHEQAGVVRARLDAERAHALGLFDRGPRAEAEAEAAWADVVVLAADLEQQYLRMDAVLDNARALAPGRDSIRDRITDMLYERMSLAHDMGNIVVRDGLRARLAAADELRPVEVSLATEPPGLEVTLYRYQRTAAGVYQRHLAGEARPTPARWQLELGSYVAELAPSGDTAALSYPFQVQGQVSPDSPEGDAGTIRFQIDVPAARDIPEGFVYIPPGAFLYGYGGDQLTEPRRLFSNAMPLHQRRTGAYLIARHETTYADWIRFLESLPDDQRSARMPRGHAEMYDNSRVLLDRDDGTWKLTFGSVEHLYQARLGEPFIYPQRQQRMAQDWRRFPVTGISMMDAAAYTGWLARERIVPGARLCREDEWERAARGADARTFSHGDRLQPDDANFDATYGKSSPNFGLDEVGSHPASVSPFGLHDTIGNAREMVLPLGGTSPGARLRSGSYFVSANTNTAVNRAHLLPNQRVPQIGFRVCADWPAR